MRVPLALAALYGMLLLPDPAGAQKADRQWTYCSNQRGQFPQDAVIAGCTAIIQSGRANSRDLVIAYTRRGNAYLRIGATERAVADYQRAIELNPQIASRSDSRAGAAQRMEGAATADLEHAIRLKRDQVATYYYNRGLKRRRTKEGREDIATAIQISPRLANRRPPVR